VKSSSFWRYVGIASISLPAESIGYQAIEGQPFNRIGFTLHPGTISRGSAADHTAILAQWLPQMQSGILCQKGRAGGPSASFYFNFLSLVLRFRTLGQLHRQNAVF
jgi:hypothetical protein